MTTSFLLGGILKCGECGSHMRPYSTTNKQKKNIVTINVGILNVLHYTNQLKRRN